MIDTFRKSTVLVGPGQRGQWAIVLALAVAVSGFEAIGMLLVFAFLGIMTGRTDDAALPVIGDVRSLAPGITDDDFLLILGVALGGFFVIRGGVLLLQAFLQYRVAEKTGARLSTRLLSGYLSMPYEFHLERNSPEMIRNAFDSVRRFAEEGLVPGVKVLSKLAVVVGVVGVLLVTSPVATLLALGFLGPLTWGILRTIQPKVKRLGALAQEYTKLNLQSLQQGLHGFRDIRVLGREQTFVGSYETDRHKLARTQFLRRTAAEAPRVGLETGVVLFIVAFVGVAGVIQGEAVQTLPVLGLFGYAAVRLLPEMNQITRGLNQLKFVGPAIDSIYGDLVSFEQYSGVSHENEPPVSLRECLRLDSVCFRYPGANLEALTDINVEILVGESVGIVGPTGGGKSTLVDVVSGLLEPTSGSVLVDGTDIRKCWRGWQANIGIVPQMVFLTDDTVRRNIALGVPDGEIDEGAMGEAVSMAQLDDFIADLPSGLDSYVGERGVRVSGGQRQRLAIARALYRRPEVLIFDEGTSALDNQTEIAVMEALERLRGERTMITVAHRLTTVESCDRVFLVEDGRVLDAGAYDELASRHAALR